MSIKPQQLQPSWNETRAWLRETRAWLDYLCMGRACVLATPQEARANLEATLAIEHSVATRRPVTLPLAG